MRNLVKLLPVVLAAGLIFTAPANARNYDCSKAGNANKAACKTPVVAPAKPAKATPASKPVATRNYDCSKPGNANKAVCKSAAAAPAPATTRNYDCTKPGNANKTVCKGIASTPASSTSASSASRPATQRPASAPRATTAAGPQGATAQCNDGTYSHSATHSGACSHHGGVKSWY